ncbi:MAG: hypothetical protein ABJA98_06670 [Acidobacteriota bacterium]
MRHPRFVLPVVMLLIAVSGYTLRADVKTDEKTRVQFTGVLGGIVNLFGGKSAREGVTSTVAVKGDRKATTTTSGNTGRIVDLGEEKIYDLDLKRKTYTVITFADLRRQIEEARRKGEEEARKAQARDNKADKAPERDPNAKEMEIDFDIKSTGQKKNVSGFDTHEVVLTIAVREKGKTLEQSGGLLLTSDMWLAPTVAALKEIRDFDIRMMQKLASSVISGASPEEMGRMLATYPMMKDALAKMSAEGGKIDGTPLTTTLTFDTVKAADQVAQESKQSDDDKSKDNSSVGGLLGGLARRATQKRGAQDENKDKARVTFMTSTTEILKISTDVAAADVAVPAGFKENK